MRKGSRSRLINGVICAVMVAFFLVHGALGSASLALGFKGTLAWLAWFGIALVAAHVIASVVTSYEQLTDTVRPPSVNKKRHLALKWVTGALLAVCIVAHVLLKGSIAAHIATIALDIVLAVHLCVGSKSILKDLNIDRKYRTHFRVAVCVVAAVFVIAVLASAAGLAPGV